MDPSEKPESRDLDRQSNDSGSKRPAPAGGPPARWRRLFREQIEASQERRRNLLEKDDLGRTPLFYAAENGLEEEVWDMIFSFRGTGLSPTRLTLIATKDNAGLTAADVAEQNGHEEIARLLRSEQGRMEYFE